VIVLRIFLILCLLTLISITSTIAQSPDLLHGAWEWQRSFIIGDEETDPISAGYTMQCSFNLESQPKVFRKYIDGVLTEQSAFFLVAQYVIGYEGDLVFYCWEFHPISENVDGFLIYHANELEMMCSCRSNCKEKGGFQYWARRGPVDAQKLTWSAVKLLYR